MNQQLSMLEDLYETGSRLHQAGRLGEAERCYRQLLAINPLHPGGLHLLGVVAHQAGRSDTAIQLISRAIAIKSDEANFYCNLGNVLSQTGKFGEAILQYRRAIMLQPDHADAINGVGYALQNEGRFDEAISLYQTALLKQPAHAEARLNLAVLQLLTADFVDGWLNYEWRWRSKSDPLSPRSFTQPQWRGEPLQGSRIFLYSEQGLGDTLQFLRYVPMVAGRGGVVLLQIHDQLHCLCESTPGVTQLLSVSDSPDEFDWHCPLMSLPLAFETVLSTIPKTLNYISIPKESKQKAAALPWPSKGMRIGLSWAGSPTNKRDGLRSIDLSLFEPLFSIANSHYFSLQIGTAREQLAAFTHEICDLQNPPGSMADTAAKIMQLDLVISVDTAVAHLAATLGKPVWILLPHVPDWRWLLNREDSPWYPSARLFRQTKPGDWQTVVQRLATKLATMPRKIEHICPDGVLCPPKH